jgi:hypothetical protein
VTPLTQGEKTAKAKKIRERREKQEKHRREKVEKERREAWEHDIRAVRSPNGWSESEPVGRDLERAIANTVNQGEAKGDIALFQGGRVLAVVTWKDGRPMITKPEK